MRTLYHILLLFSISSFIASCKGQTIENEPQQPAENPISVGGSFENSEFTYYGIPKLVHSTDTSPGWALEGDKILVRGTVFQKDSKTPAPDVLLYYYQTNTEGRYVHKPEEERSMAPNALGQTHGFIRGWVKSDAEGKYNVYTVKPGTYPTNDEPAHIHITVKEPNDISEYYIDDFVFEGDPLLTAAKRNKFENRCGSGILRLVPQGELLVGERNIILGLNIPDYP